jgi:mannose-6-phosphate isomerase-like protein (cupin superfamily)
MIVKRADAGGFVTDTCHEGTGQLACVEMLRDYERQGSGLKYLHDDTLEPGTSIGEHTHTDDEEIYFVLEGHGTMIDDGKQYDITVGDMCITGSGHSHGIINGSDSPMRLLVVCTNI